MISQECVASTNDSNIKVSEARSTTAVFMNHERANYCLIRFDGCVVKNDVACDWIVEKQAVGRVAVELKGSDVDHAALQIERALAFLKEHGMTNLRVSGLIICSRYPNIDTKVQRLKQKLAKTFKAPLHVKTDGRNLNFEQLLSF